MIEYDTELEIDGDKKAGSRAGFLANQFIQPEAGRLLAALLRCLLCSASLCGLASALLGAALLRATLLRALASFLCCHFSLSMMELNFADSPVEPAILQRVRPGTRSYEAIMHCNVIRNYARI